MPNPGSSSGRGLNIPKLWGRYQFKSFIWDGFRMKVWIVTGLDGQEYTAKMTKLDENGSSSKYFLDELGVYSAFINENIRFYQRINTPTPHGFPNIYFVGRYENYDVIILEYLNRSVTQLRNTEGLLSTTKTVSYLKLASDMLYTVMALHQHGFIHRDLKPQKFRVAHDSYPYLLDFIVAKRYIDQTTGRHCPPGSEQSLVGGVKYASVNAHRLMIQSRRDDLISLGYCIIAIMKGALPWDTVPGRLRTIGEVNDFTRNMKESTSLEVLCSGLPERILSYMQNVTSLNYDASPDYTRLQWIVDPNLTPLRL